MQLSAIPAKFPMAWAAQAQASYIRTIPAASQINVTPGAASLTDGFPPVCFQPTSGGGIPPYGQDINGILNQVTAWLQWMNAGGPVSYDATFAGEVGGYPKGATLASVNGGGLYYYSTADGNTTNPDDNTGDAASSKNWISFLQGGPSTSQIIQNILATGTIQQIVQNPTLYVSSTQGSDTNSGTLANPFQTIAAALAYSARLNFASSMLTIKLLTPGAYACPANVGSIPGQIVIQGDVTNPSQYYLQAASGSGFPVCISNAQSLTFQGVGIVNNGNGSTTLAASAGQITVDHVAFSCPSGTFGYVLQANPTASIVIKDGCSISGNGQAALGANGGTISGGNLAGAGTVTLAFVNSPTLSIGTLYLAAQSSIYLLPTFAFSGSVSGAQWDVGTYSVLGTAGRTGSFVPGNPSSNTNNGSVS